MAYYIPPHRRHPNGTENSSPPIPERMGSLSNHNNNLNAQGRTKKGRYIYTNNSVSRWLAVGFEGDNRTKFPSSVTLQPVRFDSDKRQVSKRHLALILNELAEEKERERVLGERWVYVAENVVKDLISSLSLVRNQNENEELRPTLVARFGKVIFKRGSFSNQQDLACEEATLRSLRRVFNPKIPKSYMEYIVREGAQKIGFELEDDKVLHHVQVLDSTRPDSAISCKFRMLEDGKPGHIKIELQPVNHMEMDISCTDKNLDMRLMLYAKRKITSMTDDEEQSIRELINPAVSDGAATGWSSDSDRFCVDGKWLVKTKSYVNQSMKLKVTYADRFKSGTLSGKGSWEITIKFKGIASTLEEHNVDEDALKKTLESDLRVLWGSLFCCESYLKW